MTIPGWLARHLEQIGAWNTDGVGRVLRGGTCPTCRARVLRGLDADRCASAATVDPGPVDTATELTALLAGRVTYDAWPGKAGPELERRDEWTVQTPPSAIKPVLVEHRCGQSLPIAEYARPNRAPVIHADSDEVPF